MATTYGALTTQMADALIKRNPAMLSAIGAAINKAVRYYTNYPFWFTRASATITATTSNGVLDLSSITDFNYIAKEQGLSFAYNNRNFILSDVSTTDYTYINDSGSGMPYAYTTTEGGVKVYYLPDQAYSFTVRYAKSYPILVSANDTNDFLTYAEDMIEAKALAFVYRDNRHEFETAREYDAVANDFFIQLLEINHNNLATGFIAPNPSETEEYYYA